MCNLTACNPVTKECQAELDSQNAAISWGPLTAANFTADYQVIAWSGAGLATYSGADSLVASRSAVPIATAEEIFPTDISLFSRQIAADNSSVTANYSSWIPQVDYTPVSPAFL